MTASVESSPPLFSNRLAAEKSPYLVQHAHNPVDWYPWGEEAFAKARLENKPIFLSVGYSTCHWCHVMAHESFENEELARLLNKDFVSIKVDREERPDIDRIYMLYVQTLTSSGGWPLSVWLTSDLKPFFGGTYFPSEDNYGRPGFGRLLTGIAEAWRTAREQIESAGETAVSQLRQIAATAEQSAAVDASLLENAYQAFKTTYDPVCGGFGGAPKFPRPATFAFLLRRHARTGDAQTLDMVLHTLRAMAAGGVHDQLGGGFHRYATDAAWLIPHFEKMLYDQAQLACAYLEAYQVTGDAFFADIARDVLNYVQRELTGPEGQFLSAEDADSAVPGGGGEKSEGAFYTWSPEEVRAVLGEPGTSAFGADFGLGRTDNLVDGKHVLARTSASKTLELRHGPAVQALLTARARRPRPHCDDKAVTAWNGLMLSAFARAYQVLGDGAYRETAERAAAFIRQRLFSAATGLLFRRYREGEAAVDGYAEDYAFLIQGLLDLYEADFDTSWLEWAQVLQAKMTALFWDPDGGGYFGTPADARDLPVRMKETHDGAEPSANSVAALNLLRLGAIMRSAEHHRMAERLFTAFGQRLRDFPESLPQMLTSFAFACGSLRQIVIAGKRDAADTQALLRAAQRPFVPNKVVLLADGAAGQTWLSQYLPQLRDTRPQDGHAAAYVCDNFACQAPVTDASVLADLGCDSV
jgi:hypothetical protein